VSAVAVGETAIRLIDPGYLVAHQLVGAYASPVTGAAAGKVWKITRHDPADRLIVGDETVDLLTQGLAAGDSVVVFVDQMLDAPLSTPSTGSHYARLRIVDAESHEGYHRVGVLSPGQRLDIAVPLDWAWTDNEQPNVTMHRTRSALAWGFAEGPHQRKYQGRIVGDANRFREKLRYAQRYLEYEVTPVTLIIDADGGDMPTAVWGRVVSGNQQANAGWYVDSDGILRTAGDLSITFNEEV
jgi:hypothetical protein